MLIPTVLWAQRKDKLYLTIDVQVEAALLIWFRVRFGEREHRAPFRSLERILGYLLEHEI
jgi:hypothetical protein